MLKGQPTQPLTAKERDEIRIAHHALMEAKSRARARGLTQAEIDAEGEDDDSEFWADVASITRELREKKAQD